MADEERPPLDEARRAFVVDMLQRMPESLSQAMLADDRIRADLGVPVAPTIRVFDRRFDGAALMAALRDVANSRPVALRSVDGSLTVDEATLEADGSASMVAGEQGARFANVGLLAEDVKARRRALGAILRTEDLAGADEERFSAAIEAGPLDDDDFVDLERLVEETPKAVYRRLHAEVSDGVTFDALVPTDEGFYRSLLGGPSPTLAKYKAEWLARAAALDATRRAASIALTAPLAALRGNLVSEAAAGLDRAVRLRLARFLANSPDPFSRLAGFELAAVDCSDPNFRSIGDELLPSLLDRQNSKTAAGLSFLASAVILTATFSAKRGALLGWPVYARRLAWHLHASILTRTFGNGAIDPEEMRRAVGRPFEQNYRLVELCDARTAPLNLWGAVSPSSLHAAVVRRVGELVAGIPEEGRPAEWSAQFEDASKHLSSGDDALSYLAPAPFEQFEESWDGLPVESGEEIGVVAGRLRDGTDVQRSLTDLLLLAVAFDVNPADRPALVACLPNFIARLPGETFVPAADLSLQLAARWRLPELATKVVDLSLARTAADGLADLGAPARFSLLAAAASEAEETWTAKVSEYMNGFAFTLKPGPAVRNMLTAIGLISEFAPDLGPVLTSARSFALIATDTLPALPAGPLPRP